MRVGILFTIASSVFGADTLAKVAPIAIFHGMHDNCTNRADIEDTLTDALGVTAECIEVGNGKVDSILMNFEEQCQLACENLKAHPSFKDEPEINVIGLSQGGLIARYIVEACDWEGQVRNLITVGTPNMGVINHDHCIKVAVSGNDLTFNAVKTFSCIVYQTLNKYFTFNSWFDGIALNSYFRFPEFYDEYLEFNAILPRLNNEVIHPDNEKYRDRMRALNSAVFVQWDSDRVVWPRISQLFDSVTPPDAPFLHPTSDIHYHHRGHDEEEPLARLRFSQDIQELQKYKQIYEEAVPQSYHPRYVIKMEASDWYEQDNLGLRSLDEAGRLFLLHLPGDHYKWTEEDVRSLFASVFRL